MDSLNSRDIESAKHCERNDCRQCVGASRQDSNHYALGRLRQFIGMTHGIPFAVVQSMSIRELMEKAVPQPR